MSLWPVVVEIVTQSNPALCLTVASATYVFQVSLMSGTRGDFTVELICSSVAPHEFYRCDLVLRYVIVYPFNEPLIFFVKIFLVYIEFIPCW